MSENPSLIKKITRKLPLIGDKPPLVSVLDLQGVIAASGRGKVLNLKKLEKPIEKAFAKPNLQAVALRINSPGGSPVQSRFIMNHIREIATEKKIKVLVFVEDVAASGGYILACAGDEIFADESSIVGSIGVLYSGFGFTETISKLGIERRVHTAGKSKNQLDPFKPEDPEQVEKLQNLLDEVHVQFIDLVKSRREGKIGSEDDIFTGDVFLAGKAKQRGLIDGIGTLRAVCRSRFGEDVEFAQIASEEKSLLARLASSQAGAGGKRLVEEAPAAGIGPLIDPDALLDSLEERALWSRYGL
jgi:signal peptide peptidase SppA